MIDKKFVKDFIEKPIKEYWDLPAFTDLGSKTYKFSDVARHIAGFHKLFDFLGIQRGDKIALIGKNSAFWTMTYLSVVTYGAVIVPVLADFHPREVHYVVNHSGARILIGAKSKLNELDFSQMQNLELILSYEPLRVEKNSLGKELDIEKIFKPGELASLKPEDVDYADIPNSELVEISYTSGSTGTSKGVMLSANNLAANIDFANRHMPLKPGDHLLSILPLAHSFGCAFEFLFPFNRGVHIHFLTRKPTPTILLDAYRRVKPHLILSVPLVFEKIYQNKILPQISKPAVKLLLKIPGVNLLLYRKMRQSLIEALGGRFTEVILGGAPLNEEVELFFRKIKFPYTVGYGMTECGPLISYASWKQTKFRSCGKLVDTLEARVEEHPEFEGVGEILVRGENVMLGYYKNPDATAKVLEKDGWLHTGDLGTIDDENFIFIKGRAKSLLLGPSGENIFPEEIEDLYINNPYVEEVLVVMRENYKLVALIYPNFDRLKEEGINPDSYQKVFENLRKEVNLLLPKFKQVSAVELRDEPFEKTPKRNIKRFLYS